MSLNPAADCLLPTLLTTISSFKILEICLPLFLKEFIYFLSSFLLPSFLLFFFKDMFVCFLFSVLLAVLKFIV